MQPAPAGRIPGHFKLTDILDKVLGPCGRRGRLDFQIGCAHGSRLPLIDDPAVAQAPGKLPDGPHRPGRKVGREAGLGRGGLGRGRLLLLASPDGRDGSIRIHQDVEIRGGLFDDGEVASIEPDKVVFRQNVNDPNRLKQFDEIVRELTD